jgi:hypothetical protein
MDKIVATCCWCKTPLVQLGAHWWCATDACNDLQRRHAVGAQVKSGAKRGWRWLYVPTPKQVEFDRCPAKYVLFGGAAGPGKSHAARWALYRRCLTIPGFEALLLRRTFPELEKTHLRRMASEEALLREHGFAVKFTDSKRLMTFHHGPGKPDSIIECGHMEDADSVNKYLSTEYDCIVPDEGSTFEPQPLLELSTRARTSKPAVKAKGGAKFWVVTNPGGPATNELIDFFIDHSPDMEQYPALVGDYNPAEWAYVPGTLDDNPYIDDGYVRSLAILPKWRYEQLRNGNFRVFTGQFFDMWEERRDGQAWHVTSLTPSKETEWFGGFDWGRASPGCMLWLAALPDGRIHVGAEWKFSGMPAEEVAPLLRQKTKELGITRLRYIAADPNIWAKRGEAKGESIAETLQRAGLPMRRSDNDRSNYGWARVVSFLRDRPTDDGPWLTVDESCKYLRRTIPAMRGDKTDPEDVDTALDDHGVDALRYACLSRPSPTVVMKPQKKLHPMLEDYLAGQRKGAVLGSNNVRAHA